MDLSDAQEKLYDAVQFMATSTQHIRSRLETAYRFLHTLQLDPTPNAEFAKRLNEIMSAMTGGGNTVQQALLAVSDAKAEEIATKLFDLFCDVQRACDREENTPD
jgi:hypothetical protein